MRMLVIILGTLGCMTLAWWSLLYTMQSRMMFPADMAPRQPARPPARAVVLTRDIEGGQVEAWLLPALSATPEAPAPLVVLFHGNAEIIDEQNDTVAFYHSMGCSVLLPEFRSYNRSAGVPSQAAIREDALYFCDQVLQRSDVDRARVAFFGRSIGAALAADLALQRKPAALVLQSPFYSGASMAHRFYAPGLLLKSPFHTDKAVRQLDIPILIMHGTHDEIIPFTQGRDLAALSPRATFVAFDCGHNDFPGDNLVGFFRTQKEFLSGAGIVN